MNSNPEMTDINTCAWCWNPYSTSDVRVPAGRRDVAFSVCLNERRCLLDDDDCEENGSSRAVSPFKDPVGDELHDGFMIAQHLQQYGDEGGAAKEPARKMCAHGWSLQSRVPYVSFADQQHWFSCNEVSVCRLDSLRDQSWQAVACRLFVGQTPHLMTPEQLAWCLEALTGCEVLFAEKIMRKESRWRYSGSFHVYVRHGDVAAFLSLNDYCVLMDLGGMWAAESDDELRHLRQYVMEMQKARDERFHCKSVPRGLLSVAIAKSGKL